MKTKICLLGIFAFVTLAIAAPRTWVLKTGEMVTGDYVSSGTNTLVVKTGGTNCFLKISDLSTNDQVYVVKMRVEQTRNKVANRESDPELAAIQQQMDEVEARLKPLLIKRRNYEVLAQAKRQDNQPDAVEQTAIRELNISIVPLQNQQGELRKRYQVKKAQINVQRQ